MDFEIKKITTETLGEYLREARVHFGLSLRDAAKQAGVKMEYLTFLESGEFQKLPPEVYVCGFLQKLASVYGVSADELVVQYRKELAMLTFSQAKISAGEFSIRSYLQQIVITPKVITAVFGFAVLFITIGYIIIQVISLNGAPMLVIHEPVSGQPIRGLFVRVNGSTDSGASVRINDQSVFVGGDGGFDTTVGVNPGQKELVVVAENKFGKRSEKKVLVVVEVPEIINVLGASTSEFDGVGVSGN